MNWIHAYLEARRQRAIEDEERQHRHWVELTRRHDDTHINATLASYRAAIVALQNETRNLRNQMTDLEDRINELESRRWQ